MEMFEYDKINPNSMTYRMLPPHRQFGKTFTRVMDFLKPLIDILNNDIINGRILYSDDCPLIITWEKLINDLNHIIDKSKNEYLKLYPKNEVNTTAIIVSLLSYNYINQYILSQYLLMRYVFTTVDNDKIHCYPFNFYPKYILLKTEEDKNGKE